MEELILSVVNGVTAVSSIFTNFLVFLAILTTPTLHTPSNVLICSLALSDFSIGLIVQPIFIVYLQPDYRLSVAYYMRLFGITFTATSLTTMTAIAVDRYLALSLHMRYIVLVTVRRTLLLVTVMWILYILITICISFLEDLRTVIAILVPCIFICLLVSSVSYVRIYCIVRRHRRQIVDQVRATNSPTPSQGRSIRNMFYLHGLFATCLVPFIFSGIASIFIKEKLRSLEISTFTTWTILFLNSFLNPYLYCWRMRDIRRSVLSLITKFLAKN